jgi:hypothetical protein
MKRNEAMHVRKSVNKNNNESQQHNSSAFAAPCTGEWVQYRCFCGRKKPPQNTTTQKQEKKKCTTDTCTASSASAEKERVAAGTRGAKADDRAMISLPRVRNRSIATVFTMKKTKKKKKKSQQSFFRTRMF